MPIWKTSRKNAVYGSLTKNPDGRLEPGMYATLKVHRKAARSTLLIPTEAVIRTGTRNVVMVAQPGGRFEPVAVTLGEESGVRISVLSGLFEGQRVVVSGQLLIDSEASLQGVITREQP